MFWFLLLTRGRFGSARRDFGFFSRSGGCRRARCSGRRSFFLLRSLLLVTAAEHAVGVVDVFRLLALPGDDFFGGVGFRGIGFAHNTRRKAFLAFDVRRFLNGKLALAGFKAHVKLPTAILMVVDFEAIFIGHAPGYVPHVRRDGERTPSVTLALLSAVRTPDRAQIPSAHLGTL